MVHMFELTPVDGRKSFYGKCFFSGNPACYTLYSYGTPVARYDLDGFTRLWGGYSVTTLRHINAFVLQMGHTSGGKAWWDSLPVGVPVKIV